MSFSPIIRVRKLLDKMKMESSPRIRRFPSRTSSADVTDSTTFKFSKMEINSWVGESQFQYLPNEAILMIFSFLESDELLACRLVSKEWNHFANDKLIWKNLCFYDWNVTSLVGKTWKETYFRLEELFSDGTWEGMSKWIEPAGYDNEQKTTARLCFQKRRRTPTESSSFSSPAPIRRVDSNSNVDRGNMDSSDANSSTTVAATTNSNSDNSNQLTFANFQDSPFKIVGGGVTVNCQTPSAFKIEGERVSNDPTGSTFQWNKQFERHTSVYNGRIDFQTGSVSGTIDYHDGNTHWKGQFYFSKLKRSNFKCLNA